MNTGWTTSPSPHTRRNAAGPTLSACPAHPSSTNPAKQPPPTRPPCGIGHIAAWDVPRRQWLGVWSGDRLAAASAHASNKDGAAGLAAAQSLLVPTVPAGFQRPGAFVSFTDSLQQRRTDIETGDDGGEMAPACARFIGTLRRLMAAVADAASGANRWTVGDGGEAPWMHVRRVGHVVVGFECDVHVAAPLVDRFAFVIYGLLYLTASTKALTQKDMDKFLVAYFRYGHPLAPGNGIPNLPFTTKARRVHISALETVAKRIAAPVSLLVHGGAVVAHLPDWLNLSDFEQDLVMAAAWRHLHRSTFDQLLCLHDSAPAVTHRVVGCRIDPNTHLVAVVGPSWDQSLSEIRRQVLPMFWDPTGPPAKAPSTWQQGKAALGPVLLVVHARHLVFRDVRDHDPALSAQLTRAYLDAASVVDSDMDQVVLHAGPDHAWPAYWCSDRALGIETLLLMDAAVPLYAYGKVARDVVEKYLACLACLG
ncbi:hypothetical protein GGF32_004146 [Allomyces javanicus]|nr:hypothetical protein GGF32_004146 [Allomyces javanicus]